MDEKWQRYGREGLVRLKVGARVKERLKKREKLRKMRWKWEENVEEKAKELDGWLVLALEFNKKKKRVAQG